MIIVKVLYLLRKHDKAIMMGNAWKVFVPILGLCSDGSMRSPQVVRIRSAYASYPVYEYGFSFWLRFLDLMIALLLAIALFYIPSAWAIINGLAFYTQDHSISTPLLQWCCLQMRVVRRAVFEEWLDEIRSSLFVRVVKRGRSRL